VAAGWTLRILTACTAFESVSRLRLVEANRSRDELGRTSDEALVSEIFVARRTSPIGPASFPQLQPGIGVLAQIVPNVVDSSLDQPPTPHPAAHETCDASALKHDGRCFALSSTLSGNWWRCKVHTMCTAVME
jgi:hypothetical protein